MAVLLDFIHDGEAFLFAPSIQNKAVLSCIAICVFSLLLDTSSVHLCTL